jgi:hypothetical protein
MIVMRTHARFDPFLVDCGPGAFLANERFGIAGGVTDAGCAGS